MASVSEAILALDPNCRFVLHGEPTDAISFNAGFRLVTGVDANDLAILSDDPDDWEKAGITWGTVKIKLADLNDKEPIKLLREERNRLIAETDWWASSDLDMPLERAVYRQQLRDITKTYTSLDDVVWPDKPE
tara:strand:+ start:295 stop:693 length:399 start_codon:yes stop_codon:yes gene_type:complete